MYIYIYIYILQHVTFDTTYMHMRYVRPRPAAGRRARRPAPRGAPATAAATLGV